jgi:hypothetical protein
MMTPRRKRRRKRRKRRRRRKRNQKKEKVTSRTLFLERRMVIFLTMTPMKRNLLILRLA